MRQVLMLLICTSLAHAVPARPLYVPLENANLPQAVDLRGTTWRGKMFDMEVIVFFEANGGAGYTYNLISKQRVTPTGTWTVNGKEVYIEISNKASEHRASVSGSTMEGESTNRNGRRAFFFLKRVQ